MAVKKNEATRPAPATTQRTEREGKKTLGFLNINMATRVGNPIRVEAIRLMEGNKTHEQIAMGLSVTREGDEKLSPEERARVAEERLANLVKLLNITFNPTRTEEESALADF